MSGARPHYPWKEGDALFASELNAAIANSAAYGPYLPLTGGNVSGEIDAKTFTTYNHRAWTGGTLNTSLGIYADLSGTRTGGNGYLSGIRVLTDTADMGGAGLCGLFVEMNGGTTSGAMGGRSAIGANVNFTGAPGNKAANTGEQFLGVSSYCVATGNVGGVPGSGGPYGSMWGGLFNAQLEAGATNWNAAIGCEINVGVAAGANASYVTGIGVVLGTHQQGPQDYDALLGFAMLTGRGSVGLKNGIVFGGAGGWWPIHPTGSLFTTATSLIAGGAAYLATHGIDLTGVTFSGTAFRSTGFSVDGAGAIASIGLTASSPSGNDPLHVTVASGNYARVNYTVTGTRSWTAGVFPTGSFIISDESVGARFGIDTSGLATFTGRLAALLTNAANDAAAASAGVPVGAMYRNANAVQVRLV
jgi:hypothetical protein